MNVKKGTMDANFVRPSTLGSIATATMAFAVSQGMTLDEIARATDISAIDYANLDARLPDPLPGELMSALMSKWPSRAIPLEIARSIPFSTIGGLVHGVRFSRNLEAALEWLILNQSVISEQSSVDLVHEATESSLVVSHPSEAIDNGGTLEAMTGLIWRLLNENVDSELSLIRVEFAYEKESKLQAYQDFFHSPISFQTGRNALVFSKATLGAPILNANPQMFDVIEHQFAELRQKLDSDRYPAALANLRQSIMANAAQGEYGAAAAAAAANLSLRTAQRLAKQHDTSLQQLIDEIRLANAKKLLSNLDISIEATGYLLGYADARAFRRAFKRWTSLSPKEYRKVISEDTNT